MAASLQPQASHIVFDSSDEEILENNVYMKEFMKDLLEPIGFQTQTNVISSSSKTFSNLTKDNEEILLVIVSGKDKEELVSASRMVRSVFPTAFLCIWHEDATEDAFFRQRCFGLTIEGANMVSFDSIALASAANLVKESSMRQGQLICPFCHMKGFSEDGLWCHCPLFHVYALNHENINCPICNLNCNDENSYPFPVHLRNDHGPCSRGEIEPEKSTGLFAIVICRRPKDGKFLMVQEFANSGFWVPGGQLDAGESLRSAVERETIEEAGIKVKLLGVLEVLSQQRGRWRRVVFYAEPLFENENDENHMKPKSLPDYESTGACWVTINELNRGRSPLSKIHGRNINNKSLIASNDQLKLRGSEPLQWFNYIHQGGEILPLAIPEEYKQVLSDVPF